MSNITILNFAPSGPDLVATASLIDPGDRIRFTKSIKRILIKGDIAAAGSVTISVYIRIPGPSDFLVITATQTLAAAGAVTLLSTDDIHIMSSDESIYVVITASAALTGASGNIISAPGILTQT